MSAVKTPKPHTKAASIATAEDVSRILKGVLISLGLSSKQIKHLMNLASERKFKEFDEYFERNKHWYCGKCKACVAKLVRVFHQHDCIG